MSLTLVPENFEVPQKLEHEQFIARKLCASDTELDYQAVMSSIDIMNNLQSSISDTDEYRARDLGLCQDSSRAGEPSRFAQRKSHKKYSRFGEYIFCDPTGSRTPITRMRTWRPEPLDDGARTLNSIYSNTYIIPSKLKIDNLC